MKFSADDDDLDEDRYRDAGRPDGAIRMILSLLSQKGGVGKSTLARLIAVEFLRAEWSVKVADLDPAQGTSTKWALRRDEVGRDPEVEVQKFRDPRRAVAEASRWDLLILDGPAHADRSGLVMAQKADLTLLPTGYSLDDLEPQISLAYDLEASGVARDRIRLAFCRARGSASEDTAARSYLNRSGFEALDARTREMASVRQAHMLGRTAGETGRPSVDREALAVASEVAHLLTRKRKRSK